MTSRLKYSFFLAAVAGLAAGCGPVSHAPNPAAVAQCASAKAKADQGDWDGAIAGYSRAIELDGDYVDAYNQRGAARRNKGDLTGAIADWTKVVELRPDDEAGFINRSVAKYSKNDFAGAVADLNQAIALNPYNSMAYCNRAAAEQGLGNLKAALADCNAALKQNPDLPEAYYDRSKVERSEGKLRAAIADCDHALKLKPNYGSAYYDRSLSESDLGELPEAIADCTKAIDLKSGRDMPYVVRGLAEQKLGDLDAALRDFNAAARLKPLASTFVLSGDACAAKLDYAGAIKNFTAAIQENTNDGYAYVRRCICRGAVGNIEGAIADANEILRLDPHFADGYANRGRLCFELGDYSRALADCEHGQQLNPHSAVVCNNLAWVLAACPDPARRNGQAALPLAREACELAAWTNGYYVLTLAASCAAAGDFSQAVEWQSKAIATGLSAADVAQAKSVLALYQQQKPWYPTPKGKQ